MASPLAHSLETAPIRSTWISANAGSGKTSALVDHVVKLLLLGVTPERICCITYTRAAAAEMRARVTKALRELLLADEATCRTRVAEFLERPASEEEVARARTLFGGVMDSTTGGIQLTTIHGFCQQILRAFPLEAGVPPYFTVLEETESELLTRRATHELLSGFGEADDTLAASISLLIERAPEQKFELLVRSIFRARQTWKSLWRGESAGHLKAGLYALHGLPGSARREDFAAAFCQLPAGADALRAELPQLLAAKAERQRKLGAVLALWCEQGSAGRPPHLDALLGALLTKEFTLQQWIVKEKTFSEAFRKAVLHLAESGVRLKQSEAALACAEESYALAMVAHDLIDRYDQLKEERGALDYDDLIVRTHELLTTSQMMAWVMNKLDHRIDHLLIDEAQDTSEGQWRIAEALVGELVVTSGGMGSGDLPRSLLVVGDEKQSIFSFQGADPELFALKQPVFMRLLERSMARLEPEVLDISYRSAPAILKLVDAVAALPHVAPSLSVRGKTERHRAERLDAVGEVTLYPPISPEEKAKPESFTIPTEYQVVQSGAQLLADTIAEKIVIWLKEGRPIADKDGTTHPIHAGDILVLVRNRKPIVPCLIRALQRKGVPVAGIDRLMLAEHLAVKDMLALMRWVSFSGDDLALAQVLRSPLLGFSDEMLRAIAHGRGALSLWDRLEGMHPEIARQLSRWREAASLSPYDFLTQLLEVGDARRRFAARFGEEVHEVLDELKEQALRLPSHLSPNLANFAGFISGSAREVKREQEARGNGEVRVMTVYGAKGLEAPVVVMADTMRVPDLRHERVYTVTDGEGREFPVLQISDDAKHAPVLGSAHEARKRELLAEYHRLLYVALTRARDELHVFGATDSRKTIPEDSWYRTIASTLQPMAVENADGSITLRDAGKATATAKQKAGPALKVELPAWANVSPLRRKRLASVAPSRLQANEALAPFARYTPEAAKERGVRIHRVLQFLGADTSRGEVGELLAALAPDWDEPTRKRIEEEVWALYRQEHWLWQAKADAEVNISGEIEIAGEMVAVNGQIDRLVRTPDGIVILDYKTGRHIPQTLEEVPENYLLQLKTYAALLSRMEPGATLRSVILWTAGPRLMDVSALVAAIPWGGK